MLCDVAAPPEANNITIPVCTEFSASKPIIVQVSKVCKVCHFFTEIYFEGSGAPGTTKITTIQFLPDSDLGKEQVQRAWIRRIRITPSRCISKTRL